MYPLRRILTCVVLTVESTIHDLRRDPTARIQGEPPFTTPWYDLDDSP